MPVPVGLTLQPDAEYLDLLGAVLREEVGYYEVTPETLWWQDQRGALHENRFHARFLALAAETGLPVVGHGVGLSLGSRGDDARRRRWLGRLREDGRCFRFRWYTEHLGTTAPAGLNLTLPQPLWLDAAAAPLLRRRLDALRGVAPRVGVENSVVYFLLGDAPQEARLLRQALQGPGRCLLLDLHNLYTMAQNTGLCPDAYLDALDLSQVVEIHLSGGRDSQAAWLASGRVLRLDSHDDAVPEPVWRLFSQVLPRCPGLRGVTLERMEGTVTQADVPRLREELQRAKRLLAERGRVRRSQRSTSAASPERRTPPASPRAWASYEATLNRLLLAAQPRAALQEAARDRRLPAGLRRAFAQADGDGVELAALLVARLRFERVLRGSPAAERWFDEDPAAFVAAFRCYHHEELPTAFFPAAEGRAFRAFCLRRALPLPEL